MTPRPGGDTRRVEPMRTGAWVWRVRDGGEAPLPERTEIFFLIERGSTLLGVTEGIFALGVASFALGSRGGRRLRERVEDCLVICTGGVIGGGAFVRRSRVCSSARSREPDPKSGLWGGRGDGARGPNGRRSVDIECDRLFRGESDVSCVGVVNSGRIGVVGRLVGLDISAMGAGGSSKSQEFRRELSQGPTAYLHISYIQRDGL